MLFRPFRAYHFSCNLPRLALWAAFFRRFAASGLSQAIFTYLYQEITCVSV